METRRIAVFIMFLAATSTAFADPSYECQMESMEFGMAADYANSNVTEEGVYQKMRAGWAFLKGNPRVSLCVDERFQRQVARRMTDGPGGSASLPHTAHNYELDVQAIQQIGLDECAEAGR
jgi:hypothetical protein